MEQSFFFQWVQKYFPGITLTIVSRLNDSTQESNYLHRRMLKKDYSVSGKWESINIANTLVMADVVAMDSSLPLKKRDSIGKANGDIPKMGMELKLNEKQLTDLNTLISTGGTDSQILAKLFADTPRVISGIYERNEEIFLRGLSTGVGLVADTENVGTGIRIDYGYLTANKFGVSVLWNAATDTTKPFDDIQRVLDKVEADGNVISKVMLDQIAFNQIAGSDQAKTLFAFSTGVNTGAGAIPAPSLSQVNTFASDRYGFTFEIVKRSVRSEENGIQTVVKPWAEGAVVFLTSDQVGSLVYAKLAEQDNPVTGVSYQTVDDFILVSKFRTNRPSLGEFTTSQARVVPVISGVSSIYLLDSKTVQA